MVINSIFKSWVFFITLIKEPNWSVVRLCGCGSCWCCISCLGNPCCSYTLDVWSCTDFWCCFSWCCLCCTGCWCCVRFWCWISCCLCCVRFCCWDSFSGGLLGWSSGVNKLNKFILKNSHSAYFQAYKLKKIYCHLPQRKFNSLENLKWTQFIIQKIQENKLLR